MSAPEDALAEILAEHQFALSISNPEVCTCGWEDGFVPDPEAQHRAHVAQVLAEWVAEREARAWDACVAAATGGGLTPLAQMLRDDCPYRKEADRG